jgi:hypothetical protein
LLQDLHFSARQLIKTPGFTLTAVISLALGIGAATAVFSVIYAVLMHPYPAADRIVRLTVDGVAGSGDPVYLNGAEIQTLRQSPVPESVLASDNSALMLTGQDHPETVHAVSLISNNFQDLGVPPLLGRELWPSELGNLSAMWRNQGLIIFERLLSDRALKCDSGTLCDATR